MKKIVTRLTNKNERELLKGSIPSLIVRALGIVAVYFFVLIVTRNYGAGAWGNFTISFTVLQIGVLLGRLGIDKALLRFISKNYHEGKINLIASFYKKSLAIVFISSLVTSCILFFSSDCIAADLFHKPSLAINFRIAAFGITPFTFLLINAESIRGLKKVIWYSFFERGSYFFLAFLFFLALPSFYESALNAEITLVLSIFILSVLSFFIWRKSIKVNTINDDRGNVSYNEILKLGLPMMISGSALFIMSWAVTIMLGIYKTEEEVGVFNIVTRIASLNSVFLLVINSMSGPRFSELHSKGEFKKLETDVKSSTRIIFIASAPILLFIFLAPHFLIKIFGNGLVSNESCNALLILAFGEFVNAMCGSVGLLLQMTGKHKIHQNIFIISLIINILLNIILIPSYGIIGGAISTMVFTVSWNFAAVYYIKKHYGFITIYNPFRKRQNVHI